MNEFAQVASELAEYEAFERFRSNRPDLPEAERRPRRLARALRSELLNASVMIAAATSLANAMEASGPSAPGAKALLVYLPEPTGTLAGGIERLFAEDVDLAICQHLQAYAARLALAQRMSHSFANDGGGGGAAAHVDAEILADAWRRTCAAAREAIAALGSLEAAAHEAPAGDRRILDLLLEAEGGGRPCVEADGRITIPGWAERRRDRRHEVRQDATVRLGGTSVPATIRDASLSGLGLELDRATKSGERLAVRLPGGRELRGEVAWANGRRAGLKLDTRLSPADPLLSRGARPVRLKPDPAD